MVKEVGSQFVLIRRTAFDFPLALFLASALLGLWTAYDQDAAWAKFWPIVIGVAIFYLVAWMPERVGRLEPLRVVFALLPAIVGVYFFLTNDWREPYNATRWLYQLLPQIAEALPVLSGYRLHANTLSGLMAVFIPLQIAAFFNAGARLRLPQATAGLIAIGASLAMLILGRSQGAVWALALTTVGWLLHTSYMHVNRRWAWPMTLITLAVPLVIGAALFGERLLGWRVDRADVWQNSFALASDYLFTGLGLDNFAMPYSTYVLLVHVEHTYHAHNLYLDLWLNQGLPGLVAFVAMLLLAFTRHNVALQWRTAALASVTVLALHGIVDDAFYGYYGGKFVMLMFMPFGLLARPDAQFAGSFHTAAQAGRLRTTILVFASVAVVVALAVWAALPATRAAFYRNRGALAQTKAELSAYRLHRESNLQDGMRLRPDVNLQPAMDDYLAALAENPWDAGANRRLAQIELTFRQYDQAHDRLLKAYAAAAYHRATRQLLGESYAIRGEIAEAVRLWRTLDVSQDQLTIRTWWYALFTQQEERARWIERAIAALEQ